MRASRLISLVLLLQSRGTMTAGELARELEVSERTVYRDVLALSAAGVPVYADRGRAGGYRLLGGYRTRLTGLTRDEAEALFLAGLPGPAGDMGLADAVAVRRAEGARRAAAGPARRAGPRRAAVPPGRAGLVPGDRAAAVAGRAGPGGLAGPGGASCATGAATGRSTRRVQPYGLVLKSGVWYLVGRVGDDHAHLPGGPGRRGRGAATRLRPGRGLRPGRATGGSRPRRSCGACCGAEVTVRLSPAGLRRSGTWSSPLRVRRGGSPPPAPPDGQGWVVTRLPVESVDVAYSQLLRLGPEVEVLDPPELRARIAEAAARARRALRMRPTGRRSAVAGDVGRLAARPPPP